MANDREFIIQPLITEGRVVKLSDIDPTTSYAQIGVWQDNQRQSGSSGNSYPSYVIPLSELSSPDFKNYLIVDSVYGNDADAIPYDTHKPYQSVDAAIVAANPGDTIVLNSGTHFSFGNIMGQSQTFYCMPGVTWYIYSASSITPGDSLKIFGYGDIYIIPTLDVQGGYDGDIIIEGNNITFSNYAYLVPTVGYIQFYALVGAGSGYTDGTYLVGTTGGSGTGAIFQIVVVGGIVTNATIVNGGSGYLNGDNLTLCKDLACTLPGNAVISVVRISTYDFTRTFKLNARKKLEQNGVTGMLVVSPWIVDIEAYEYVGNVFGPGGAGIADFWMNNDVSTGIQCVNSIRFENAYAKHDLLYIWGDAAFINCSLGGTNNKLFVDINNLVVTNVPLNVGGPFMLRMGPCAWQVYFKAARAVLNNSTVIFDHALPDAKVLLEGKYYVDIQGPPAQQRTPLWLSAITLECKADIIATAGDNPTFEIFGNARVDINNCRIINTGIAGTETGIRKNGGSTTKLRLKDAKVLASTSIIGITGGGEDCEVYACYTNIAPVNMNNTLAPATAFVVSAAMTDNNF